MVGSLLQPLTLSGYHLPPLQIINCDPPPADPSPSVFVPNATNMSSITFILRKNLYEENMFHALKLIRPNFSKRNLDFQFRGLEMSALKFASSHLAMQWASDVFREDGLCDIPVEMIITNSNLLIKSGSIEKFVQEHILTQLPVDRLSEYTVEKVCGSLRDKYLMGQAPSDDKSYMKIDWVQYLADIEKAKLIARDGIDIVTDPNFKSSSDEGPCPKKYLENMSVINAHIYQNCKAGSAFLLSKEVLHQYLPGNHLQNLGWATASKPKGRMTSNLSGTASRFKNSTPLNSQYVKDEVSRIYGKIVHPTLIDICNTIVIAQNEYGSKNVVIYKDDVRGYFQLAQFQIRVLKLVTFAVHSQNPEINGSIYVSNSGNFGWCGMGFVFEVFTRILRVVILCAIFGKYLMYCDDGITVSDLSHWKNDRCISQKILSKLFGIGALAPEKFDSTEEVSKSERWIVLIGWLINLSTNRVMVARENQLRANYYFFSVDLDKPVSMKIRQRLCSLAERYSTVFHELKVIMVILYSMLGGKDNVHEDQSWLLTKKQITAIRLWRYTLCKSEYDFSIGVKAGRDLTYFTPNQTINGILEFDGSPYGGGWRLFNGTDNSICFASGYIDFPISFYPEEKFKSDYQNSCEFTALNCALVHAIKLGWNNITIEIRGDSDTVLHWVESDHFRSELAIPPIIMFLCLCEMFHIHVKKGTHIKAELNFVCDSLSRLKLDDILLVDACGPVGPTHPSINGAIQNTVSRCRLSQSASTQKDFLSLWQSASVFCASISSFNV